MPATWPNSLPAKMAPPATESRVDGRAQFQPDAGPVHIARQYTADPIKVSTTLRMSQSQWDALTTFYVTTLAGGVREFEWSNPWPSAGTKTFRFADPPSVDWDTRKMRLPVSYIASGSSPQRTGRVTLNLWLLPWYPAS